MFDEAWAREVFAIAVRRLRDEFVLAANLDRFERLKRYLTAQASAEDYSAAGADLGMTGKAVTVAVHRMRKQYAELVREEVGRTVACEADIDDELRYLCQIALSSGSVSH